MQTQSNARQARRTRRVTGAIVTHKGTRGTSYAARFTALGERRFVTLGSSSEGWNRQRAEEELQNILADVRRGTWTPPRQRREVEGAKEEPSFQRFASEWFNGIKREVRPSTATVYEWHLSHFLVPHFEHHRLSDITVQEVDRYRQAMVAQRDRIAVARARGETTRKPASNETINKTIVRLGQILDQAVEYGHIAANPARGKRRKLKTSRPTRSYLDAASQIVALLDAADELDAEARRYEVPRRAMLATLVFSGLRLGEFLPCAGATWT